MPYISISPAISGLNLDITEVDLDETLRAGIAAHLAAGHPISSAVASALEDATGGVDAVTGLFDAAITYDPDAEALANTLHIGEHFLLSHDPADIAAWLAENYGDEQLDHATWRRLVVVVTLEPSYNEHVDLAEFEDDRVWARFVAEHVGTVQQAAEDLDVDLDGLAGDLERITTEGSTAFVEGLASDPRLESVETRREGTTHIHRLTFASQAACTVTFAEGVATIEANDGADPHLDVYELPHEGFAPQDWAAEVFEYLEDTVAADGVAPFVPVGKQRDLAIDALKRAYGVSKPVAATIVDESRWTHDALPDETNPGEVELLVSAAASPVSAGTVGLVLGVLSGQALAVSWSRAELTVGVGEGRVVFDSRDWSKAAEGTFERSTGLPSHGGHNPLQVARKVLELFVPTDPVGGPDGAASRPGSEGAYTAGAPCARCGQPARVHWRAGGLTGPFRAPGCSGYDPAACQGEGTEAHGGEVRVRADGAVLCDAHEHLRPPGWGIRLADGSWAAGGAAMSAQEAEAALARFGFGEGARVERRGPHPEQ